MLKKLTKKKALVRDMTTKHTVTFLNSKKIHLKPPPPPLPNTIQWHHLVSVHNYKKKNLICQRKAVSL